MFCFIHSLISDHCFMMFGLVLATIHIFIYSLSRDKAITKQITQIIQVRHNKIFNHNTVCLSAIFLLYATKVGIKYRANIDIKANIVFCKRIKQNFTQLYVFGKLNLYMFISNMYNFTFSISIQLKSISYRSFKEKEIFTQYSPYKICVSILFE